MLRLTGGAPGRPDVQEEGRAQEILPRHRGAVGQAGFLEIGQGLIQQRRGQLVGIVESKAPPEHERHEQKEPKGQEEAGAAHEASAPARAAWSRSFSRR